MPQTVHALRTRATWTGELRTYNTLDYTVAEPERLSLHGETLWVAVEAYERRRQTDDYGSTLENHRNGEVWVHWENGTEVGSDRYQPLTDHGVRLGGCRNHNADQCWWLGDPFPIRGDAMHIVVGPLSRLATHRHCEWAATMGEMHSTLFLRTMPGSVGEDRCCYKPFALTYAEQAQVTSVAAHIASVMGLTGVWVRNFDLLVGWRLFGVYDDETRWPGFNPIWDLDPAVMDCWMVQMALREMA